MTTPGQPADQPQGYPGQPGQGYPGQPDPNYPSQPDPNYPSQPGYPGPGYGSQSYPSQPGQGYPGQPDPNYPGQPGYPGPGYAGQPGYGQGPYDPSAPFGRHPMTGEPYSDKQKIVAGLLQIFLGGFGAGRWYLGNTGIALAQLFTCGGLGIWALIDGIMILTGNVRDQYGRPLRD